MAERMINGLKSSGCCPQVPCGGVLVAGSGHRCSHGNSGGDSGDLGAVPRARRAGGNRLQHGQLRLQQRHHYDLHAGTQDTFSGCECVCLFTCVCACVFLQVFPSDSKKYLHS